MLRWKMIMERWHLTHEDVSICRLVQQVAVQTSAKICPACLDAIADERLQWQRLNQTEFLNQQDGKS
jgi:predicted transcriptional regulator